jgi:cytochrome c-type biogenesis protein CcmH
VKRSLAALSALLLAACLAAGARADSAEDEARRIGQEIQCPVCQGLSVADSPSQLATQMRGIIRSKLEAGENRDAIVAYFVDRYGESILMTPPRSGAGLGIWLAPYLAALAILGFVFFMIRRRQSAPRAASNGTPPDDPALDSYLEEVDRAAEAMRSQPLR